MNTRGVPYEQGRPIFGQPSNNNPWNIMRQEPATEPFRVEMSAPAPPAPPRQPGEPSGYDGFNGEPPRKDKHRLAKIAGAVGIGSVLAVGTVVGFNSMSGDNEGKGGAGTAQGGGASSSEEVPFGAACRDQPDRYQQGILNIYDGYGNVVPESLNDLENNIMINDGATGENDVQITDFPQKILDQVRQSYDLAIKSNPDNKMPRVYFYGEVSQDSDNTDGKVNDGLKACAGS